MKKILVAIDARNLPVKAVDFACYIARLTHSNLTGLFLDNAQMVETLIHEPINQQASLSTPVKDLAKGIEDSMHRFREVCANRGTNCTVHFQSDKPLDEITAETRFAELLILDPEMSFKQKKENIPSGFIKEVLAQSECPVLLAPFDFHAIEEIILAYDGSPASVYAIKQFTYLFPELKDKKLTVLEVNKAGDEEIKEKGKLAALLTLHYPNLAFELLQGKAADELFGYLLEKKHVLVVMGAFERNGITGLFSHSTAELIIKTINAPVFIAHRY